MSKFKRDTCNREKMIAKEGRNERMNEYAFHSLGGMELVVTRPFEKGFAARSVCNFQQGRLKCRVEEGMQKMRFAGTSVCTEITGFRCWIALILQSISNRVRQIYLVRLPIRRGGERNGQTCHVMRWSIWSSDSQGRWEMGATTIRFKRRGSVKVRKTRLVVICHRWKGRA